MKWYVELEATLGKVVRTEPVHGGSINEVCRVTLADKRMVFVKTHHAPPLGMYAAEAHGLTWLRPGPLRVPRVIAAADSYLALEWIDMTSVGIPDRDSSRIELGRGLAALHALGAPVFGLDRDNFLATIPQDNTPAPDMQTFWIERRLAPVFEQIRLAEGMPDLRGKLDELRARPELFGPPEPPARLHGDLWTGNVGLSDGEIVIFDPSVYGGHREIDLAMLDLFDGLRDPVVDGYHDVFPLTPGWRPRLKLWQLYPLACHAVMFGGGYVRRTAVTLDAVLASR
jgi:fructosamine-3-kinase